MTSNAKESAYKAIPPARMTFKHLYLLYKNLYDNKKISENGAAYKRMVEFKSKIIKAIK